MPNMVTLYQNERRSRLEQYADYPVPPEDISFDVRVDTETRRVRERERVAAVPFEDCAVQLADDTYVL